MSDGKGPRRYPSSGRRAISYVHWDEHGEVEDYVDYALERLRQHAALLVVTVNGELSDAGRARLDRVADLVLQRENHGFDVAGHREALARLGAARLADFDELVLANSSWYGPLGSFEALFDRADPMALDLWGVTEHPPLAPNPFTGVGTLPWHLQSYWLAVRRRLFTAPSWARFWADLPSITTYRGAVLDFEVRFAEFFVEHGFEARALFPHRAGLAPDRTVFDALGLLEEGAHVVKRKVFLKDFEAPGKPAVPLAELLTAMGRHGYPLDLVRRDLRHHLAADDPRLLRLDGGPGLATGRQA